MPDKTQLFDQNWLSKVKSKNLSKSWAEDVLQNISGNGGKYLSNIKSLVSILSRSIT